MNKKEHFNKLTTTTVLLTLIVLLIAQLASCTTHSGGDNTTASGTEQTSEPISASTTSLYEADDLPESLSLGETVTMLYWEDVENAEFFSSEEASDAVEIAIKNRNAKVENRLGVTVEYIGTPGNFKNRSNYENKVRTDISAGASYDIYAAYSMTVANCAYSGFCADLLDFDVINLEKPWWPDSLTEEALINNRLYFASGDISTNMLYMMYVMYFSKTLVTDYALDDPYDVVESGSFTIDKMIEMSETVANDIDGDSKLYGLVTSSDTHLDPFFYGAGLRTLDRNADGELIISDKFGSGIAIDVAEKLTTFINNGHCQISEGDYLFMGERALFEVHRARFAGEKLSNTDIGFGIIPIPKYSTDQDKYSTCLGFPYTLYAISAMDPHAESAAYLLEALVSESYRTVTPVLFEVTMKVRHVDDSTAANMFDMIRDGVSFDAGRIFCSSLNNITYKTFRKSISENSRYAIKINSDLKILKGYLERLNLQMGEASG